MKTLYSAHTELVSLTLSRWIVIYPVDGAIRLLINWVQVNCINLRLEVIENFRYGVPISSLCRREGGGGGGGEGYTVTGWPPR